MLSRFRFTGFCEHNRASAASVSLNRIPLTPTTSRISASRRASIGLVDPPPAGPGWLHEVRHDGFRVLAWKQGEDVKVWSRRSADFTDRRIAEGVAGSAQMRRSRALTEDEEARFG